MDMRMVDNEDQREDRKLQAGKEYMAEEAKPEMRRIPSRRERRLIAKRKGVFKRPGLWGYINNGARKNEPIQGDHQSEN